MTAHSGRACPTRACLHYGGDRVSTPMARNLGAKPQAWRSPRQGFATTSAGHWGTHPSGRSVARRIAALQPLRGARPRAAACALRCIRATPRRGQLRSVNRPLCKRQYPPMWQRACDAKKKGPTGGPLPSSKWLFQPTGASATSGLMLWARFPFGPTTTSKLTFPPCFSVR